MQTEAPMIQMQSQPQPQPQSLPSDQSLLHAYTEENNHHAFEQLTARHAPWLFAAALRQLKNHHAAEDAVQIVFIFLAKRAHTMHSPAKLSGWLFNTLQFALKNFHRSNRNRLSREQKSAVPPIVPTPPQNPIDLADSLDAAVAKLPAIYRTVILLRFYQQLSIKDLCQTLNLPEPTIRKRLDRALLHLKKSLSPTLTATSLAPLATLHLTQAPSTLAASIAKTALAAKAGATLTPSLALASKGTAYLMATAKLKLLTAAALALLIALPATLLTYRYVYTRAPAPSPAIESPAIAAQPDQSPEPIPTPAARIPDPKPPITLPPELAAAFAPQPNHPLRYIPSATPEQRAALFDILNPSHNLTRDGTPPESFVLEWKDPTTLSNYSMRTGALIDLTAILKKALSTDPSEVDNLQNTKIPGDFSYLASSTDDARLADLQSILTNDLHQPLTLQFTYSAPQKIYLLQGTWKPLNSPINLTTTPTRAKTTADPHQFALFLTRVFDRPVLIDSTNAPQPPQLDPTPRPPPQPRLPKIRSTSFHRSHSHRRPRSHHHLQPHHHPNRPHLVRNHPPLPPPKNGTNPINPPLI